MTPIIDDEFKALIPPLSDDEYALLRTLIIEAGRATDPLKVWDGVLIDGHNRFAICQELGLPYTTAVVVGVETRLDAKIWIVRHQFGRRNLPPYARAALALVLEPLVAEKARENLKLSPGRPAEKGLLNSVNLSVGTEPVLRTSRHPPIDTRGEIAKAAGVSRDTIAKAKVLEAKATPEQKERLVAGKTTVNREYTKIIGAEKKAANDVIRANTPKAEPTGRYGTIVIDPPWEMQKIERDVAPEQAGFEYPTMTEGEIAAYPVNAMAEDACHLFCWTTHKHLPSALRIIERWGFAYVLTMVWHKNGGFQPYGLPQYNCEFILYGRRGAPSFVETKAFPVCFKANRREHSRKPDEFYDMIRRVTDGARIDVFSREPRDGFAQLGNETDKFGEVA